MNLDQARFNMVEQQIRPWDVLDPKVLDLLMDTPRHEFVAESQVALAYSDIELPIGHNQTMLHPRVEGKILQAVDVQGDESVLEIGTGSGFMTALLAKLADKVTTVEIFPELQETAKARLEGYDNITFQTGDASQDWNDGQEYDVIMFTGAMATLPDTFKHKLTLGGRLLVTLGVSTVMTTQLVTRIAEGEWEVESLFETVMPTLVHATKASEFKF
ncbi:protein-L-isoaspartate O-methyltransferase family protein [Thiosulfativibrio zosterae]|uniref:Protein-L-isoaspartate O-methyltransferase n=1 Tax=Thiosulfativibrio zosterae TaxID=2675053 RepID=A0A6F8PLM0_9GAMM|nr:protein-L-isoaspartate O-methyltransferase [Thiosulfativibrio zosterae]BBP42985.1 protein-L-isoaspartate O-methyltransferase [Thiosulfativibrio zosterae]